MRKYVRAKSVGRLFILILIGVITAINANAQTKENEGWAGTYTFTDAAQISKRRQVQDVVPTVEYTIGIKKSGNNRLTGTFEANAMQTFEIYECAVKEVSGKLSFYFQSGGIPDGGLANPRSFKQGALLFTLVKTKVGAETQYQFESADYKLTALNRKTKGQPIYFNRLPN